MDDELPEVTKIRNNMFSDSEEEEDGPTLAIPAPKESDDDNSLSIEEIAELSRR